MSNTVITNYTDLNGPSTKADSSVVVIVNKDGSLSVDEKLLGTLMGTDGSGGAVSVVRVGHEGPPDDATDSDTDYDEKVPHVTLTVDSYYDEPNSIIKYDSGAEMLQTLRIETRENSLLGFHNDHCYTPLTSPDQSASGRNDSFNLYDEPIIEIKQQSPPKSIPSSKKITILDQKIIPKGRKITINPGEGVLIKGNDIINKPLVKSKKKQVDIDTTKSEDSEESSSTSTSEDSIQDRDSDSDYKQGRDKPGSGKKTKLKPRILKSSKTSKVDKKLSTRLKANKNILRKEFKEKLHKKSPIESKVKEVESPVELKKETPKQTPKASRREKKTPSHMTALFSDMTSLFSTPDVIRRVSTDNKTPATKDPVGKKTISEESKPEVGEKSKAALHRTAAVKQKNSPAPKSFDLIPQIDDASLAQILQDNPVPSASVKGQPTVSTSSAINCPSLAGPLSPTLDLLGGLQPEEEGLTEDLLMHVAQLVESSENLKEVIDKQVLGKVEAPKTPFHQVQSGGNLYQQTPKVNKTLVTPRKDPIEIVRRDGRVITLPPIEAPATRASKRKSQITAESTAVSDVLPAPPPAPAPAPVATPDPLPAPAPAPAPSPAPADPPAAPAPPSPLVSKQYTNRKLVSRRPDVPPGPSSNEPQAAEKTSAESQESWNSEDDPYRLWCICRQPHNNRFMICCDSCEDWFHGKCVNITKAMGQSMEEQGIEWRCPNCVKKTKGKPNNKLPISDKKLEIDESRGAGRRGSREMKGPEPQPRCIVCRAPARAASIYCSDACIRRHAQDALPPPAKADDAKPHDKKKSDSRVIVFERKSGRCLAGSSAPTTENLREWLQKNPTFEVVRPGTLSATKPKQPAKKIPTTEPKKIQTTLSFPKKVPVTPKTPTPAKEVPTPKLTPVKEHAGPKAGGPPRPPGAGKAPAPLRSPPAPRSLAPSQFYDNAKPSTSTAKSPAEVKKPTKAAVTRSSTSDKAGGSGSPATPRRREAHTPDGRSKAAVAPVRESVRKALLEQMMLRMKETKGAKFTAEQVKDFAVQTEAELHELFKDVGVKYKAKYRSLMFNIKDRKNLSLWQKICDKTLSPNQLVRLSPEELASQELAQWRDQEAKHQLELIKKSELDLLAASKTYVLKTHKGEEVMQTKSISTTELDPNVAVEDLVTALNESTGDEPGVADTSQEGATIRKMSADSGEKYLRKRDRDMSETPSKKSKKDSRHEGERRSSRASRKRSGSKPKEDKPRRSERRSSRFRSASKERKAELKEKAAKERSRRRSRSRSRSRRRSGSGARRRRGSRDRGARRERERSKRRSVEDRVTQRSRSQDHTLTKNDSTDSDSIERPKSAMMKEAHPEYDPHEPMITSALSDEELRKSRDDLRADYDVDYAAHSDSKPFTIKTDIVLPRFPKRRDKTSEAESDQEPSSTVDSAAVTVWNGCINMVDVARFYVSAHEVSGVCSDLEEDLCAELDVVGRINPHTVWEYISKMRRTGNKDINILRLQAANDEERMQYIALYSYLSSRNRLGVVQVNNTTTVKDFYIVPLAAGAPLPAVLLPLDGPGLDDVRSHLLIGIVIRQRKKRAAPAALPKDVVPAKVARGSRKRSYTPPVVASPAAGYTSHALSSSVKDKIAASLAAADNEEAYSPGSSSGDSGPAAPPAGPPAALRSKMDELNRQIEEQKLQIMKMAQVDSSVSGDDEAYSPSRPLTPPAPAVVAPPVPLADIALPSNLQEILATIKQRSETAAAVADVDMRVPPPEP